MELFSIELEVIKKMLRKIKRKFEECGFVHLISFLFLLWFHLLICVYLEWMKRRFFFFMRGAFFVWSPNGTFVSHRCKTIKSVSTPFLFIHTIWIPRLNYNSFAWLKIKTTGKPISSIKQAILSWILHIKHENN